MTPPISLRCASPECPLPLAELARFMGLSPRAAKKQVQQWRRSGWRIVALRGRVKHGYYIAIGGDRAAEERLTREIRSRVQTLREMAGSPATLRLLGQMTLEAR